ncbi:MAG TPA: phosphohydrolase, partial [Candidatus Binatia bacterium]|nr:phosphohydrolase [Candidatus Binatia bacterium]
DLDSKMESMRAHFGREPEAEWTTYNTSLERPLLNSKKFLEKMKSGNGAAAEAAPDVPQQNVPQQNAKAVAADEK